MVDYNEQKNYWEGIAKRRKPWNPVIKAFAEPKLDFILRTLPPPPEESGRWSMLEVGAGNGYFSFTFDQAFDLTALDFSQNMLDMNPLPAARKVCGNAESLPFDDDSFDVVFCGNLLHHLEQPLSAVGEMKRVARRFVVLLEPNTVNPLMFGFGLLKKEERGTLKFTPAYMRKLGADAGLTLLGFSTQGMILPNKTPEALLPVFESIDVPSIMGFYHVAVFGV